MNALRTKRTLLIGIGNDGRADDALGWRFAEAVTDCAVMDIQYRYQLQIEDAELICRYDEVIFADASHEQHEHGFHLYECRPAADVAFTTHRLSPEAIVWLAQDVFGATPRCFVMAIDGREWKLKQGLSRVAEENLMKALVCFNQLVPNSSWSLALDSAT